ncbi:MAG: SDR family oxidoreductase [Methyloligellaceae bacterium]
MILVTGACGKSGQAVIQALVQAGEMVRAFVHRDNQVSLVKSIGASEQIIGKMEDEFRFRQATDGVKAIYHICSNMNQNEFEIGQTAIAAARESGASRFVYHSVLHPQTERMPHHWQKLRVEELLFESGLEFTILQPAPYMQNILSGWHSIIDQGLFQIPYAGKTRISTVDLEDIAEIAAKILIDTGHIGATYEFAGPQPLSQIEVAEILENKISRKVRVEQVSLVDWERNARATGLDEYKIESLLKMFRYYDQFDFCGNPKVLECLLKRPATDFEQFVERIISQ